MLELKERPEAINGTTPYLYEAWYRGAKKVLRHVEFHRRPLAIVENMLEQPEMKILDVGCDWGYLLMYIKDQFKDSSCHGIDISDQNVEFGNALAELNGYKISCKYGNATKLEFDDNHFDYIVSTETFEHLFPPERVPILKECCRVLKPGGYILITTPSKYGTAEVIKQALGKLSFFKKLIPMLPGKLRDEGFAPGGATRGDKMTNIAESTGSLRSKMKEAGFKVLEQKSFIFIPEITPNSLFKFMRAIERIIEQMRIFNFMATTQFIKAQKPE